MAPSAKSKPIVFGPLRCVARKVVSTFVAGGQLLERSREISSQALIGGFVLELQSKIDSGCQAAGGPSKSSDPPHAFERTTFRNGTVCASFSQVAPHSRIYRHADEFARVACALLPGHTLADRRKPFGDHRLRLEIDRSRNR
jgi:hypothetical protein